MNKRLGQHFLIDKKILGMIVEAAAIQKGDKILEVGPGLGVLTRELLDRGAEVMAIERDRRFLEFLVGAHGNTPLQIISGDATKLNWDEIVGRGKWKFVSNLPYSITSLALRKALYAKNPPEKIVVLVQHEVAERAITVGAGFPRPDAETAPLRRNGKTSLLSLMVALASSSVKILKCISPGAFFPPPKVESAILEIAPMSHEARLEKWGIDPERVMQTAKQGFAHPRKLLASNLQIPAANLQRIDILDKSRAEDLSPEEWVRLAKEVNQQCRVPSAE